MGVLGKDLFDLQRPHTNTKVEFGAFGYWVEFVPDLQPYGAVLTEVLNLDVTPFQELLDRLNAAVQEKNYDAAPQAYMDMKKGFGSLPLYRLYLEDFRFFGDMGVDAFVIGEARDAFAESVIAQDNTLPVFMQQQINDIRFIQKRYAWFLDTIFEELFYLFGCGITFHLVLEDKSPYPAFKVAVLASLLAFLYHIKPLVF